MESAAAAEQVADLGEQLLGAGALLLFLLREETIAQHVVRLHHAEVDDGCGDQKGDRRIDEQADIDIEEGHSGEVRLAADLADEAHENGGELLDRRGENGTDDDCDGKLDEIAPHDEFLETLQLHSSCARPVDGWEAARSLGIQARVALFIGDRTHSMQIASGKASVPGPKRRLKADSGQSDDATGAEASSSGQGQS